jgi:hypothetical protein
LFAAIATLPLLNGTNYSTTPNESTPFRPSDRFLALALQTAVQLNNPENAVPLPDKYREMTVNAHEIDGYESVRILLISTTS